MFATGFILVGLFVCLFSFFKLFVAPSQKKTFTLHHSTPYHYYITSFTNRARVILNLMMGGYNYNHVFGVGVYNCVYGGGRVGISRGVMP